MKKKAVSFLLLVVLVFAGAGVGHKYNLSKNETVMAATFTIGARGDTVRQIQQKLARWGYFTGALDGVYGRQTSAAVKLFQQNNGLKPDGIVGDSTLEALGIFLNTEPQQSDINVLAAAIYGEGRGEPYEGQVAIGAVILNRVDSPKFPNSVQGVVYQRGAFDAVADGQINLSPNDSAYRAAQDALNGWDPTDGALYYWNPQTATSRWIWSVPITTSIGRHVFGTK